MPTHFRSGVTNTSPGEALYNYGLPDPSKWHTYFNDFDTYLASDWTVTETGTGTRALTAVDGGNLLITNAAADNDNNQFQLDFASFLLSASKRAYFKTRFKVSDATESDVAMGLQITNTDIFTAATVTDGIYFSKDDGDALIDVVVKKDDSAGKNAKANVGTLGTAFTTWGFSYEPSDSTCSFFIDDARVWSLDASSTYFPNLILNLTFGIQNGAAAAKTMTVDYVFAAVER